jgi:predicted acetyltransferase
MSSPYTYNRNQSRDFLEGVLNECNVINAQGVVHLLFERVAEDEYLFWWNGASLRLDGAAYEAAVIKARKRGIAALLKDFYFIESF